jgi:hypothetical protein
MPSKRNRSSARSAGTRFESIVAGYLADNVDDRIERRARNGANDRGDISGIRLIPALGGHRVTVECKDVAKVSLGSWYSEAEVERNNDGAVCTMVIHKRVRISDPGKQWVTMTVDDLVALLTGRRPVAERQGAA